MSKFNVVDIKDVDVFLFATQHKSDECKEAVGNAISQLAWHNDHVVVFVEGTSKTGELIVEKDFLLEHLGIDPSLRDKVHFYSWDLKNEAGRRLFTNNLDAEMDRLAEALKTLDEAYDEVLSELQTSFPELWDENIKREYSDEESQELMYLMNAHRALIEKKTTTANQLKMTVAQAEQMDRETFPERTVSMAGSLQSVHFITDQLKGRTACAFVAGVSHLCQEENAHAGLDLSPLFHELSNHRAMILLPKIYNEIAQVPVRIQ
ncbi:MAG: hypothetical protein JSR39_00020 [Verrucomicrobia bacterium]|nr:hypothetical protein [Verrucomicrobiota bacterium]